MSILIFVVVNFCISLTNVGLYYFTKRFIHTGLYIYVNQELCVNVFIIILVISRLYHED